MTFKGLHRTSKFVPLSPTSNELLVTFPCHSSPVSEGKTDYFNFSSLVGPPVFPLLSKMKYEILDLGLSGHHGTPGLLLVTLHIWSLCSCTTGEFAAHYYNMKTNSVQSHPVIKFLHSRHFYLCDP